MFKRHWHLRRHYTNCYDRIFLKAFIKIKKRYLIESLTIYAPEKDRYYPTFIVWDMEAVLMKTNTSSTD